jgi:hypothetical protein
MTYHTLPLRRPRYKPLNRRKYPTRLRVPSGFWHALTHREGPDPAGLFTDSLFSNGAPPEPGKGVMTLEKFREALLTDENYDALTRLCTNPDGSRFAPPNKPFYDALLRLDGHADGLSVETFNKTAEKILGAKLEIPRERPHQPWVYPDLGGLDAQARSMVEALVTPPEKSWVKPTTTGGTAQRGWLAEEGVWPPEKVKHAWDNWTDEDRAVEREILVKEKK